MQFALIDIKYMFYICIGWMEGTFPRSNYSPILGDAIHRLELNFPLPKGEKYYLDNVGYSHIIEFMGLYKGMSRRFHYTRTPQLHTP